MGTAVGSPRASTAERLNLARDLLSRANDRGTGGRRGQLQPGQPANIEVLPVSPALAPLFPDGGLPRGTTIGLATRSPSDKPSMSLVLTLLAAASAAGSWCAAVGLPQLGVVAASEAGVSLSRLALVPSPGDELVGVLSALVDGIELIAVGGCAGLRDKQRQALMARVRAHGSILLAVNTWRGADLHLEVRADPTITLGGWRGLSSDGHGRLRQRQVQLRATGHGLPQRGRSVSVLLPGPHGAVCSATRSTQPSSRPATFARRAG